MSVLSHCCFISNNPKSFLIHAVNVSYLLPSSSSVIVFICPSKTVKIQPCKRSHPSFCWFFYVYLSYLFHALLSLTLWHMHSHTSSFFHPGVAFPHGSKMAFTAHGHRTGLPETAKKERVLIGVTGGWETGREEIRAQWDADKACIQWPGSIVFLLCN